jgi:hypothetical protein
MLNNNDGLTGTWTLVVRRGTYEVSCRPLSLPGKDCGNTDFNGPLEVGALRGAGATLLFVPDAERLSRLTGCTLPPSENLDGHCGPAEPYRVTWSISRDKLTFSDHTAVERGLGLKPWTKIG